jgi:hypothetical protein
MAIDSTLGNLAKTFMTGETSLPVDVVTFAEAPWGLDTPLWPAQKVILKCLYGLELDQTPDAVPVYDIMNEKLLFQFSEKDFLEYLYNEGRCNIKEVEIGKVYNELLLVCGRRASKSVITSIISAYELYKLVRCDNPQKKFGIVPGGEICIVSVAPTEAQAMVIYNQIASYAKVSPHIRDKIVSMTAQEGFKLQSDADFRIDPKSGTIFCITGGSSANSIRGHNAIIVIFDEFSFFASNGGRFSDKEIYNALTPSVSSFRGEGKKIILSSPDNTSSYFYELYQMSLKFPKDSLMFKMYSALINHKNLSTEELKSKRRLDKQAFMREFGGEFQTSVSSWIDDPDSFKRCISARKAETRGVTGLKYYYGIDVGFKNDGCAIAIVHRNPVNGKIVLDYVIGYYPSTSDVWENKDSIYSSCDKYARMERIALSDVADEVCALLPWFPPKIGEFDHHNGVGLEELFRNRGVGNFKSEQHTEMKNSECYNLVKRLYTEGQIDLYDYPPLIKEMLILESEESKNKVKVRAPNAKGCHDDLSDAFAIAVRLAYDDNNTRGPASIMSAGGGGVRHVGFSERLTGSHTSVNDRRVPSRANSRIAARMRRSGM